MVVFCTMVNPDTRAGFSSILDTLKTSDAKHRSKLSEIIKVTRLEILTLLKLSESLATDGDWTVVQKLIYDSVQKCKDKSIVDTVNTLTDKLLDAEADLIEGNLRLVLMVVRRYTRGASTGALEEMDYVQEGCEGLLDAVRRFDFSSSKGFLSYALIRIRKRVLLALERQSRLVRIPAHFIRSGRYLREVIDNFTQTHGRTPLPEEIEDQVGNNIDWSILLSLSEKVHSMHFPFTENGIPLEEQLASVDVGPDYISLYDSVEKTLNNLDKRSKLILVMRYGLMDGEVYSLAAVGDVLGLSTERIRQIEKKAISELRRDLHGFTAIDWLQ